MSLSPQQIDRDFRGRAAGQHCSVIEEPATMNQNSRSMPRVLVVHSGRQHSHQLAMALAEKGMLARYVTGLPTRPEAGGWLGRRLFRDKAAAYAIPIEPALVKHVYLATVLRKAAAMACPPKLTATISHRADALFDAWVCRLLASERPQVVVAYENSALHTFRRAKRLGIKTVLDAASVHHSCEHPGSREQFDAARRWTNARKDAEIALADQILTVSRFARESYLSAGVPAERVHAIPVGVDVRRFRAADDVRDERAETDRNFRFVYVGNATPRKGLHVLCGAMRLLRDAGERCTATLIGSTGSLVDDAENGIRRVSWMSHDQLTRELARHDVLVLPSYFDSFGMVVAEAMACGLPVIVTENVGAKEMVTPEVNGQVVPVGEAEALAGAMRWFLANRDRLPEMSQAARLAAERYDWSHYRRRVVEFLQSL
jgi:glycosyltransferase involved in cell wall biosynthesis